jgi:hypothetical protein
MPDIEFIKQGKMEKYVNPIQSDDEEHSPHINERDTKDNSFKKLQFDFHNDEYNLDNMMSNLSMNDNKTSNPNYFVCFIDLGLYARKQSV